LYEHISEAFNSSLNYEVKQVWAVLKSKRKLAFVSKNIKNIYFDTYIPRSKLINILMSDYLESDFDFVVITDDDINLPNHFLDDFLNEQECLEFSLAQPARARNSIISHAITKERRNLRARQTLFVEIGPVVSIQKSAQKLILPLDESSPMGWGLDFVWAKALQQNNLKMGIIDCTPIKHNIRAVGASYNRNKAIDDMNNFLSQKDHIKPEDSFVVLRKYLK